jgi:hypothetical protein
MNRAQRTRYLCVLSLFVAACATETRDGDVAPVGGAGAVTQAIAGPHPSEQPACTRPPISILVNGSVASSVSAFAGDSLGFSASIPNVNDAQCVGVQAYAQWSLNGVPEPRATYDAEKRFTFNQPGTHEVKLELPYTGICTKCLPLPVKIVLVQVAARCQESPGFMATPLAPPPVERRPFAVPGNPLRFGETVVQPSFDLECKQICNGGAMKFRLEGAFRIDDPSLTYYQRVSTSLSQNPPAVGGGTGPTCAATMRSPGDVTRSEMHEGFHAAGFVNKANSFLSRLGKVFTSEDACQSELQTLRNDFTQGMAAEDTRQRGHLDPAFAAQSRFLQFCRAMGQNTIEQACGVQFNCGAPAGSTCQMPNQYPCGE